MSWQGITFCSSSAPDTNCDGDGVQTVASPAELNATAWVLVAPATGGSTIFVPANQIPVGDVVKCSLDGSGSPCVGDLGGTGFVQPSTLVFGISAPYSPPFDISQLDLTAFGQSFAAGFVLIATAFALGMPIRMLLGVIRR